jgi:hypothetical protein
MFVTTLPISPTKNLKIGHFVQPFLVDVIGKNLGYSRVLALNLVGFKSPSIEDKNLYLDALKSYMNFVPDYVFVDDDNEFKMFVEERINEMLIEGSVVIKKANLVICGCGRVNALTTHSFSSKQIFKFDENKCSVCNAELNLIQDVDSLFLVVKPSIYVDSYKIYPQFAYKEIKNLWSSYENAQILISRYNRGAELIIGGDRWYIDPDFLWSFYVEFLKEKYGDEAIVVGSSKNYFSIFRMMNINSGFYLIVPTYIVSDYMLYEEPLILRLLITKHLNWFKKEVKLNPGYVKFLKKLKLDISPLYFLSNIEEILARLNGGFLDQCLQSGMADSLYFLL